MTAIIKRLNSQLSARYNALIEIIDLESERQSLGGIRNQKFILSPNLHLCVNGRRVETSLTHKQFEDIIGPYKSLKIVRKDVYTHVIDTLLEVSTIDDMIKFITK